MISISFEDFCRVQLAVVLTIFCITKLRSSFRRMTLNKVAQIKIHLLVVFVHLFLFTEEEEEEASKNSQGMSCVSPLLSPGDPAPSQGAQVHQEADPQVESTGTCSNLTIEIGTHCFRHTCILVYINRCFLTSKLLIAESHGESKGEYYQSRFCIVLLV